MKSTEFYRFTNCPLPPLILFVLYLSLTNQTRTPYMKKFPLIFLICMVFFAFIYKSDLIQKTFAISAAWVNLPNLPYTLSHNVTIAADTSGSKILIIGGIAGDSISSRVISYNTGSALYDTTIPCIPKRLMNGFGFRIKDSIYYGGGYSTNWKDTSLTNDTLYDGSSPSTSVSYITGQKGKIYYTSNSGVSWLTRTLSDTSKNVVGISFVNNSQGWVLTNGGNSNSVYFTTNSGANWSVQLIGTGYNDIAFYNFGGWVCGDAGIIRKTTDGGLNWTMQMIGLESYKSICFATYNTGYISGTNGKIIKTTNSGINWITQTTNTTKSLNSIIFSDSLIGYAVGDSGVILKTTNGGTNWLSQSSHTILNFRSVEKINANKIIASGDRGIILYTTNGGIEWIQRTGVSSNRLNRVCIAAGDSIATAIGTKGWVTKGNKPLFEYFINDTFYKINVNNLAGGWQTKAALPIAIAEVASSAVTVNNKIAFVMGGRTSGFNYADSVLRYNPLVNSWSFAPHLPAKISESAAALVTPTKIIIVGGKNQNGINNKIYIGALDTMNAGGITLSWSTRDTSFHMPYSAMGSKGFPSKKLAFFVGGNTEVFSFIDAPSSTSSKVFMYKEATDTFIELQTDVANTISHTGLDGCISELPFTSSQAADTSIRLFAPGGRDTNYLPLSLHKFLKIDGLVSIEQISTEIPGKYYLGQNYPNPFNPVTKIIYELPKSSKSDFKIFDMLGKEIYSVHNGFQMAGKYEITFSGTALSSGIYFYQLKAGKFSETRRMVLIK